MGHARNLRKYFVVCYMDHETNAWRSGDEGRPTKCSLCGIYLRDVTLIEIDGERILEDYEEVDPDAHAIELERQGNEISEQAELEAEEQYAGEEEIDEPEGA